MTKQNPTTQKRNAFGLFLKEKRELQGFNLRQIAARLETDQATWSKYENGHRLPPKEHLPKIAKGLKISLEDIKTRYYADIVTKTLYESGLEDKVLKAAEEQLNYGMAKKKSDN